MSEQAQAPAIPAKSISMPGAGELKLTESKFSVVKTVDSGPPAVSSKAAKYLAKKAAEAAQTEAAEAAKAVAEAPVEAPAEAPAEPPVEAPAPVPAEEKPTEEKAEPEKAPEQPRDLKTQFSALAKAEKRLREQAKELEAERARFNEEAREIRELMEIAKNDKYSLPSRLGLDVEDWALKQLGKEKPKSVQPASEEVRALVKQVEELKAYQEQLKKQTEAQQYETVKRNALAEIGQVLDTDEDRYAYTRAKNAREAVFATIEYHFNQTGEIMPYADAADLVEQHFRTEAKSYLDLVKNFEKPIPQGSPKADTKHTPGGEQASTKPLQKTTVPDRVPERLTRDERLKRAAAILSGKAAA